MIENLVDSVDGKNPKKPPRMYKTLYTMGYLPYQLVSRISEPSTAHGGYSTHQPFP